MHRGDRRDLRIDGSVLYDDIGRSGGEGATSTCGIGGTGSFSGWSGCAGCGERGADDGDATRNTGIVACAAGCGAGDMRMCGESGPADDALNSGSGVRKEPSSVKVSPVDIEATEDAKNGGGGGGTRMGYGCGARRRLHSDGGSGCDG